MEPTLDFQAAGAHRAGAKDTPDALLTQHLSTLLPSGALGGVRAIQPGDENGFRGPFPSIATIPFTMTK